MASVNEGVFPNSEKSIDEDKLILYVAISRAKRLLYLSYT
ncbi:3'-5' exonuclease [Aneurinibacillus tyrosinisolvens]